MRAGSNPCRNGYNYEPRNGLCAAIDQQYGAGLLRSAIDLRRASPATVQAWRDDEPAAGGSPDSAEQSPESGNTTAPASNATCSAAQPACPSTPLGSLEVDVSFTDRPYGRGPQLPLRHHVGKDWSKLNFDTGTTDDQCGGDRCSWTEPIEQSALTR